MVQQEEGVQQEQGRQNRFQRQVSEIQHILNSDTPTADAHLEKLYRFAEDVERSVRGKLNITTPETYIPRVQLTGQIASAITDSLGRDFPTYLSPEDGSTVLSLSIGDRQSLPMDVDSYQRAGTMLAILEKSVKALGVAGAKEDAAVYDHSLNCWVRSFERFYPQSDGIHSVEGTLPLLSPQELQTLPERVLTNPDSIEERIKNKPVVLEKGHSIGGIATLTGAIAGAVGSGMALVSAINSGDAALASAAGQNANLIVGASALTLGVLGYLANKYRIYLGNRPPQVELESAVRESDARQPEQVQAAPTLAPELSVADGIYTGTANREAGRESQDAARSAMIQGATQPTAVLAVADGALNSKYAEIGSNAFVNGAAGYLLARYPAEGFDASSAELRVRQLLRDAVDHGTMDMETAQQRVDPPQGSILEPIESFATTGAIVIANAQFVGSANVGDNAVVAITLLEGQPQFRLLNAPINAADHEGVFRENQNICLGDLDKTERYFDDNANTTAGTAGVIQFYELKPGETLLRVIAFTDGAHHGLLTGDVRGYGVDSASDSILMQFAKPDPNAAIADVMNSLIRAKARGTVDDIGIATAHFL